MKNTKQNISKAMVRANMAWKALPEDVRDILIRVGEREWAREECFPDSVDSLTQEAYDYDALLELLKCG